MGFWSSAWDVVKSAGRTVAKVVKKVYEVCTSDSAVEAYDKLETIINKREVIVHNDSSNNAPDFYGEVNTTQIDKKLSEQNKKLMLHSTEIKESKK